MRLLLDTHIWIWYLLGDPRLPVKIRQELEGDEDPPELWISPITIWETLLLGEKKKLELNPDPISWVRLSLESMPVRETPITIEIAIRSRKINLPHQDPADRFIAATSLVRDLTLLTCDRFLLKCKEIKTWDASQ